VVASVERQVIDSIEQIIHSYRRGRLEISEEVLQASDEVTQRLVSSRSAPPALGRALRG
jgi:hypothetical protein